MFKVALKEAGQSWVEAPRLPLVTLEWGDGNSAWLSILWVKASHHRMLIYWEVKGLPSSLCY